jgi:pyruvate dehydrogenase E1 component alpha subunit
MSVNPDYVDLYRRMVLIRAFETRVHQLLTTGAIHGTSHLCAGQEAVAVGGCAALRPDDLVVSNHRGHGHFLARGGGPRRIMAELWGKVDGYSRGRGGSQHIACREIGFLGSNGITGGGIPVATGAALAVRMRGTDSVVLCFFGDGAANQGTFHESLNMAAVWGLPVVYLCENNLYAMSTPMEESTSVKSIADRAAAYGMPGRTVDGNDVLTVMDAVAGEAERIRSGGGPALVECRTYRIHGHSRSDRCDYRPAGEEDHWAERDPIPLFEKVLREKGLLDDSSAEAIGREQEAAVDDAVAFAEKSSLPDPAELEGAQYA